MFPIIEKRIEEFEKMGYGMFIHYGIHSLLGRCVWAKKLGYTSDENYNNLSKEFTAKEFDGNRIGLIAKQAGMKYACLTTRHHDGYSLYDTKGLCEFDAVHTAPGRDLVADFVQGCRNNDIIPFFYHTTLDWYQESFEKDFDTYLEYLRASIELLCTNYGKIGGFWFDGNWSKPDADWKLDSLYSTIRKYQPDTMIINNTGLSAQGEIGHPEIDSVTFEKGTPFKVNKEGMSKYLGSEMCATFNSHWGYSDLDFNYTSTATIIKNLCACRKVGANYLLNVGPEPSGKIGDYEVAALNKVAKWIRLFGFSLYDGKSICSQSNRGDLAIEYGNKIYLFIHDLPIMGDVNVVAESGGDNLRSFSGIKKTVSSVKWLDNDQNLKFIQDVDLGFFTLDATPPVYGVDLVVRVAELTCDL